MVANAEQVMDEVKLKRFVVKVGAVTVGVDAEKFERDCSFPSYVDFFVGGDTVASFKDPEFVVFQKPEDIPSTAPISVIERPLGQPEVEPEVKAE